MTRNYLFPIAVFTISLGLFIYALSTRGSEKFEMTQDETIELVQESNQLQFLQFQFQAAQQTFQASMIRIRKSHGWPDDLLFDGKEWHHAPKPEVKKDSPKK